MDAFNRRQRQSGGPSSPGTLVRTPPVFRPKNQSVALQPKFQASSTQLQQRNPILGVGTVILQAAEANRAPSGAWGNGAPGSLGVSKKIPGDNGDDGFKRVERKKPSATGNSIVERVMAHLRAAFEAWDRRSRVDLSFPEDLTNGQLAQLQQHFRNSGIPGLVMLGLRTVNRKSALNFQAFGQMSANEDNPLFNYHVFRE